MSASKIQFQELLSELIGAIGPAPGAGVRSGGSPLGGLMDSIAEAQRLSGVYDVAHDVVGFVLTEALAGLDAATLKAVEDNIAQAGRSTALVYNTIGMLAEIMPPRSERSVLQVLSEQPIQTPKAAVLVSTSVFEDTLKVKFPAGTPVVLDATHVRVRSVCGNPFCTKHTTETVAVYGLRRENGTWSHRAVPEYLPTSMISDASTWTDVPPDFHPSRAQHYAPRPSDHTHVGA